MGATGRPKTYFLAAAKDGRLRVHGLCASEPWDVGRLAFRTDQELAAFAPWDGRWVVRTARELDHALSVSHGVPVPIALCVSYAILDYAYKKWEGGPR